MEDKELNQQIFFKLGHIEESVKALSKFMDEKLNTLEKKMDSHEKRTNDNLFEYEERIKTLEAWKNTMTIKFGMVVAAVSTFWILLGDFTHKLVSSIIKTSGAN